MQLRPGVMAPPYEIERGGAWPLGATRCVDAINFAVYSRRATAVSLVLYPRPDSASSEEVPLDPQRHRTGDVWHVQIRGLEPGAGYGWRISGPGRHGRGERGKVLVDPYARAISGAEVWGQPADRRMRDRRCLVPDVRNEPGSARPETHPADSIIYELHVRGFTRDPSSDVAHPGTFRGIVEKIPHLTELGITAVELMPVTEFEELDNRHVDPATGGRLLNLWGYHPIGFFAPKASYAASADAVAAAGEFREMVDALHRAGIEVILDMVFNHTGEGDEDGPTLSFRGIDDATYYLSDPETGAYVDYSGCGNTLKCNHPIVRQLILDSLRYWVTEMNVDGFRFDLASVLGRGTDGSVLSDPPLLERIANDPVLRGTKLIAEAWDASGLQQVGRFPEGSRFAEWNGHFRDDLRRFVRGEPGQVGPLATRLAGSSDLYDTPGRAPFHSINFVTCHDGFTLADLVSYDGKHNEANGEQNADGNPVNHSWNCGEEGPSDSPRIQALRLRQQKNFATLLMLSQGVPMILAGDEMGRSQRGNNNAYCQDNATSWVDWKLLDSNAELFRFFKLLIRFRKAHRILRRRTFFEPSGASAPGVTWQGTRRGVPDWSFDSRCLGMHLHGGEDEIDVLLLANAHWKQQRFELPSAAQPKRWHRFIDTSLDAPREICEEHKMKPLLVSNAYQTTPRSVTVLIGRAVRT